MTAPDLVENSDRPQARNAFEQRYHLAVPNRGQWIPPPAATRRSLLRREPEILLHAIGAGGAEPGLGRGDARRLGLAKTHIQPHLAAGAILVLLSGAAVDAAGALENAVTNDRHHSLAHDYVPRRTRDG